MEPVAPAPVAAAPAVITPMALAAPSEVAPAVKVAKSGAATVRADCSKDIEGNDSMKYNARSITVPASCTDFTIRLKHVGKLPAMAMGHNVVITKTADMNSVATDGSGAGLAGDYVKAGDSRIVAHTKIVGGGESTSVTFPVGSIKSGGPYSFFCSFPGHIMLMKGLISVH
jgi:azurin